eukprot:scaffold2421_cov390-Prasinococcus_capsulatus_cf.AAC.6
MARYTQCVELVIIDDLTVVTVRMAAQVKVWSTQQAASVGEIDMRANICCVQCNPGCNLLAVGSADHNIHIYDIRSTRSSLQTLAGKMGWHLSASGGQVT